MTTSLYQDSTQHHTSRIGTSKELETTPDAVKTSTAMNHQRSTVDSTTEMTTTPIQDSSNQQTSLIEIFTESETTPDAVQTSTTTNHQRITIESTTEMTTTPIQDSTNQQKSLIEIFTDTTPDAVQNSTPTNHQRSTVDSTTGIIDIDVIIYISSGAGIFFVFTCCFVGFCVGKKYQSASRNQNLGNNQQVNLNARANVDDAVSTSQNIPTRRGSDMEYEEINEIEMSDFILSPPGQENATADERSTHSSEGIQLPTEDYLNPYQSLLPSLQQPTQEDSDDSGDSRPYTNLYEPLQQNRQEESSSYARCASIVCAEVVDEPI
ncbi:serine-rich adhesin for platelets-like isoform X3 [Mytilus edulis]|uniref:serine-rich adhesin for platelets-like isoform X3 n=1 Tax=Mytilus edulis TaxID=6550 RepID=UPI0039EE225B